MPEDTFSGPMSGANRHPAVLQLSPPSSGCSTLAGLNVARSDLSGYPQPSDQQGGRAPGNAPRTGAVTLAQCLGSAMSKPATWPVKLLTRSRWTRYGATPSLAAPPRCAGHRSGSACSASTSRPAQSIELRSTVKPISGRSDRSNGCASMVCQTALHYCSLSVFTQGVHSATSVAQSQANPNFARHHRRVKCLVT
jgi:hypothetical protein